jgi:hypothetical protein
LIEQSIRRVVEGGEWIKKTWSLFILIFLPFIFLGSVPMFCSGLFFPLKNAGRGRNGRDGKEMGMKMIQFVFRVVMPTTTMSMVMMPSAGRLTLYCALWGFVRASVRRRFVVRRPSVGLSAPCGATLLGGRYGGNETGRPEVV